MLESAYQARLVKKLKELFPDCVILKNDPNYQQGIPDLIILYRDKWAMLEVKKGSASRQQPNQGYWLRLLDNMSFASLISPDNEEGVLIDLQFAFETRRVTRLPKRQ